MQRIAKFLTDLFKSRRRCAVRAFVLWLGAGIILPASAEDAFEPLDNVRTAAERHALELVHRNLSDVRVSAGNLDPRLRLAACGQALETFATATASSGRLTVGVRCNGARPWTLYVPVSVEGMASVVTVKRSMKRGEVLGEADIAVVKRPANNLPGNFIGAARELVGKQLTRPLPAGTVMTLNMVEARRLVQRGQEVVIVAQSGGLEVRMGGVALADGASGDLVPVRNGKSGRTVEALITGEGVVRVRL